MSTEKLASPMGAMAKDAKNRALQSSKERLVITAASVGTIFEWYDFYLYGSLTVFFSALFFPPGNETAAFLASLAAFGAGFAMRPLGALLFGALGDSIGRKKAFLITMILMGGSTVLVGLLPTYAQAGTLAPVLLVGLRLVQGLAVGGEYGGAVTYVAEHARRGQRGYATSWLQTTATVGFILSLVVILTCRLSLGEDAFRAWGWRIPFLGSIVLLAISMYIRLKLEESPVFERMKAQGTVSKAPISEAFGNWRNVKQVLISLFGVTTGMTAVWYTAQFYGLFFMQSVMQVDYKTSYIVFSLGLIIGTPFIVLFGWLSDRVGRKYIMITGMVLGALTLFPAFQTLARFTNPVLAEFSATRTITVKAEGCTFSLFASPVSDCDKARNFLIRNGLSYVYQPAAAGQGLTTTIDGVEVKGFEEQAYREAFRAAGLGAKPQEVNHVGAVAVVVWLIMLVGMVYGPMAAFMVEMFPAAIRSTSLSLPYHVGVGILGGFLPFVASLLVVYYGNIYAGLWYPVIIAGVTAVIGIFLVPETKDRDVS